MKVFFYNFEQMSMFVISSLLIVLVTFFCMSICIVRHHIYLSRNECFSPIDGGKFSSLFRNLNFFFIGSHTFGIFTLKEFPNTAFTKQNVIRQVPHCSKGLLDIPIWNVCVYVAFTVTVYVHIPR